MAKVVKAGDDIRKGVTASWFNEQNKRRTQARPNQVVPYPENPISVPCIADTGIDLARFDAANIVGPAIPYEDFDGSATQYTTASVKINDTLIQDKWGIVQGPCLPEQSSHLILAGVTWANFTYTTGHTHVDVVGGALTSGIAGKAVILSPPEAPGKPGLILIRSNYLIPAFFFELIEDMVPIAGAWATARATANFYDWDNNLLFSDYLYSWLGIIDDAESGFKGTAEYFKGYWRFEQGPCDQEAG